MISRNIASLLLFASFGGGHHAVAQDEQNPPPSAPAVQKSDEAPTLPQTSSSASDKLKSMAALRVLFFAQPNTPRISIAVDAPSQKPVVIASSVPPWRGTDYQIVHPGKIKIHVLPGNVLPGDDSAPVNLSNALAGPIEVTLAPGEMGTALITENAGKLIASAIPDTINESGFPSVKIINGGAKGDLGIRATMAGSPPVGIWDSSKGKVSDVSLTKGVGSYSFLLTEKSGGAEHARMAFESTLGPQDVVTLVIHEDKYGRVAMTTLSNRLVDSLGFQSGQGVSP